MVSRANLMRWRYKRRVRLLRGLFCFSETILARFLSNLVLSQELGPSPRYLAQSLEDVSNSFVRRAAKPNVRIQIESTVSTGHDLRFPCCQVHTIGLSK